MINYADKIHEYRERKFMTQVELAKILGVSPITIVRWETSKNIPSMRMKKKLYSLFKSAGIDIFEN